MCIPRRMMFLFVRKRMNSLNEVAGIIFFLLHWYWNPRASVYLLFCYFLCAPQTERKKNKEVDNRMTIQSSGNLNLHLNGIKKGKLKRIRTLANEYNKNQNSHNMCVCVCCMVMIIQWKTTKRIQGHAHIAHRFRFRVRCVSVFAQ